MAAIVALTLNDGQTTPAAKTFTPMDCTSELATWTDRSSGIAIGMPTVTFSTVVKSGQTTRIKAKVSLPVLETISGDAGGYTARPQVAYVCLGTVDFAFPERSTLQNRKDVAAFVRNFLANAVVTKAVEEFERPF